MPDKVTEFVNVTGLTLTNFQGAGYPILTNSATETAVIRDVQVTSTGTGTITFIDSPNTIFSTTGSAKLTGTELIGNSSSVVAQNTSTALFNQIYTYSSDSSNPQQYLNALPTAFTPYTPTSGGTSTVTQTQLSTSTNPRFTCFDANGNFYYKNDSSGTLYRRAGGVNGTQTTITAGTYQACFDGRYIYSLDNYYGYRYDTTNGTNLYFSTPYPADPYYGSCFGIEGFLFAKCTYNYSTILINCATGAYANIGNSNMGGSPVGVAAAKSSAGNYIFIAGPGPSTPSSEVYVATCGTNLATIVSSGSFTGTTALLGSELGQKLSNNQNQFTYLPNVNNTAIIGIGQSKLNYINFASGTPVVTNITPTSTLGLTSQGTFVGLNQAQVISEFGTVSLRVTGIKTT